MLASLPESFSSRVTALEASEEVPTMESVTERLLHHETKQKQKASVDVDGEKRGSGRVMVQGVITAKSLDMFQRYCPDQNMTTEKEWNKGKDEAKRDSKTLLTCHVLGVNVYTNQWIVDSGATCH